MFFEDHRIQAVSTMRLRVEVTMSRRQFIIEVHRDRIQQTDVHHHRQLPISRDLGHRQDIQVNLGPCVLTLILLLTFNTEMILFTM